MNMVTKFLRNDHSLIGILIFMLLSGPWVQNTSAQVQTVDTLYFSGEKVVVSKDSTTTVSPRGRYMFNHWSDNWSVTASGGLEMYFGDEDGMKPIGDRLAQHYSLHFSKWIHPAFGLRAIVGYGTQKGYSTNTIPPVGRSLIVSGPDADGIYLQKWNQIFTGIDGLIDLSNLIGGYKRERVYSLIVPLGAGVVLALDQPKGNGDRTAYTVFGILNRFRVAKLVDINLEFKNYVLNQNYDREQTQKYYEFFLSGTLGVTVRFGKAGDRLFEKASDTRTIVNTTYQHIPLPPVPVPVPNPEPPKVIEQTTSVSGPLAVFFLIDKSNIRPRQRLNLKFMAEQIKKSNGARFRLIGSADSHTATPPYNQALSMRRCMAVRDYLVEHYGINPNQLILEPRGGIAAYTPPYVNRAVIIVQEGIEIPQ